MAFQLFIYLCLANILTPVLQIPISNISVMFCDSTFENISTVDGN